MPIRGLPPTLTARATGCAFARDARAIDEGVASRPAVTSIDGETCCALPLTRPWSQARRRRGVEATDVPIVEVEGVTVGYRSPPWNRCTRPRLHDVEPAIA